MIEYSGMSFAMFFLAEYVNMYLITRSRGDVFGGWQARLDTYLFTEVIPFKWPAFWLIVKIIGIVTMFLWIRATFPRYRYDQIMRLGWKVFIPLTIVWIVVIACGCRRVNIWR
jgi:NADH-quinone oxidoreductase subunit H